MAPGVGGVDLVTHSGVSRVRIEEAGFRPAQVPDEHGHDGLALVHSTFFMQGYREQLDVGARDVVAVVVLRHFATALALNDELWKKYELGERSKVKDPATGKDALRNPFLRVSGVLLQPSGIYATLRAQDVGCAFIKST